jgi:glycosyltransferase involved in cell wall biosynthesis
MRTIGRALKSVLPIVRRVVVVDSGSTDGTVEYCRMLGAEVLHREWRGPTNQKQFAIDQCRDSAWILLLDSDETIDDELRQSILHTIEMSDARYVGWWVKRKVWFLGGWLHHTFQPEWRLRLFRSTTGRVIGLGPDGQGGHDQIRVEGRTGRLRGICRHDSWEDLEAMCQRNIALARRAAQYNPDGGRVIDLLFRPVLALIKQLIVKRGILDGWRGVIACFSFASYTLLKHLFILQKRRGLDGVQAMEPEETPVPRITTTTSNGHLPLPAAEGAMPEPVAR